MLTDKLKPKYRRPLNAEQIEVLEILYKFRFGTVALIKNYFLGSNPGTDVFRRLDVLVERGFIAKHYLPDYMWTHKPVIYYLSPAGANELREHRDPDDQGEINLGAIYRNKAVEEPFINHCLHIFALYNQLTDRYGYDLDFLTKSDLVGSGNLPKPLPDALLQLENGKVTTYFFLDYFEDGQQHFVTTKRIRQYITYSRSGDWSLVADKFPIILLACQSDKLRQRVEKQAAAILKKTWETDVTILTSTQDTLSLSYMS
jgi:Replication-relaxation